MKNSKVQLLIGTLISVGILWFIMRNVKFAELMQALRSFNWWWAIPFLVLNFASLWLRAVRWRYLMKPTADFSSRRLFSPLMIGFAINSLLPARAGEFARAAVLSLKDRVGFAPVFATVVVERIFDSITLLIMLAITFATVEFDPDVRYQWGRYVIDGETLKAGSGKIALGLFVMVAGSILLVIARTREMIRVLVETVPFAPRWVRVKASSFIMKFAEGLASLKDPKATVAVILYSAAIWVSVAWTFQIAAYGFPGMQISLLQGVAITVITCLAILIPAAPGYWGLLELGFVFALNILSIEADESKAMAYALLVHSLQYFPVLFLGLWYLWREQVSLADLRQDKVEVPNG